MSRRASLIAKQNPEGKKSVRFPTELVFLESLKDNDLDQAAGMLRRASLRLDINAIADSGLTPLHQAVINENISAVRLLVGHGADVNARDEDSWTALHAAAAVGSCEIIKLLIANGADPSATTVFDERPVDLCDSDDIGAIGILLEAMKKQKNAASSSKPTSRSPVAKTSSLSPGPQRRLAQNNSSDNSRSSQNGTSHSSSSFGNKFSNLFSSSKTNSNSSHLNGGNSSKFPSLSPSSSKSKSEQNLPLANNNQLSRTNSNSKHK